MPKKAVSPLIATVLVIGFAIALSGIMMTWGTSFVKDIQERSEKSSLKDIACTRDVGLNIKSATVLGNKIKLVIENLGQMDIDKLNILLVGSDGGDNIEIGSGISAGGIQSFSVALDPNKIGTFEQVEAMPSVTFEGEQIACKDAVDKEENLAIDTDGLVAYYKLDGDAKDSAGNNNGIINGNPANVGGVFGTALNFDGNDDYIDTRNDWSWSLSSSFTMTAWVKSTEVSGNTNNIISKSSYEYTFYKNGNTIGFNYWNTAGGDVIRMSGTVADTNLWHFAVASYDGSTTTGKFFIDGILVSTDSSNTGILMDRTETTKIGKGYNWGQGDGYFNGIIDEVKIYNKAKTY